MDQNGAATLPGSVAQKADAVFGAILGGHRDVAAIAGATALPRTTVIRVAALLRDRGAITVQTGKSFEFAPASPA